jgi:phosphohistidine swiveling domain-containing protein
MNFPKIKWLHDVPNQRASLFIWCVLLDCLKEHNKIYNRTIKYTLATSTNIFSVRACYSEADIKEGANSLIKNCEESPNFLKEKTDETRKRSEELLRIARKGSFKEIYDAYVSFFSLAMIPELSIDYVQEEFFKIAKKEYINILLEPPESFLNKEKKELLAISKKKNFEELLEKHAEKYFWIENNYIDTKKLDKEYFRKRLQNLEVIEPKEKEELLKKIKDKKLILLTKIIEFLVATQDIRKRTIMEASYYLNILLEKIGKERGYTLNEMFLLKADEIITNKKVSKEELARRKEKIIYFFIKGKRYFYSGKKAIEMENLLAPIDTADKEELKGMTANQGYAEGKARVIRSVKELENLQEGEILVTSNTTPDYVPYLKKVKAIVAAKGGVTTHTAIISREMNIPCVIGIKHITEIIKTGQKIIVDANKGKIKKF